MTHLEKENLVIETAANWDLEVLVETGTFLGTMVEAVRRHFDYVYTIELDKKLAMDARVKFALQNVDVLHGDSGQLLAKMVQLICKPTLYWLDAHSKFGEQYAGHPLLKELDAFQGALEGVRRVILIDDMHLLGKEDFPSEAEVLARLEGKTIERLGPVWRVS